VVGTVWAARAGEAFTVSAFTSAAIIWSNTTRSGDGDSPHG
jgi:hypothetical protein